MAVGSWTIYGKAKYYLGTGAITLNAGVFKMSLHTAAASAAIVAVSSQSTFASIGNEISARGGYATGGRNIPSTSAGAKWVQGASAKQWKFTYTTGGLVFTANGSALNNIKYALIRNSTGVGAGKVLCYCKLSDTEFDITSPNTLTIIPAAVGGVFTLA